MFISQDDLSELKRLAANTYEQEKSEQIHRIIRGINKLESMVASLSAENKKLKEKLQSI
jgi:cell shape-determining protein MreC